MGNEKIWFVYCGAGDSDLVLMGSWAAAAEKTGFVDIREVMLSSNSGKKVVEDFKKTREESCRKRTMN